MRSQSRGAQQGFVLVLTIAVLAAMAVAAAYFGQRVQSALRLATSAQNLTEAQLALNDGKAEVLFRLATTPFSWSGLGDAPNAIRLDGRPYAESGGVVQLQDDAGLVNLNATPNDFLYRFLGTMGVQEDHRAALIDTLRDFTDEDDLKRLSGAEAAEYRAIGRPDLPPNRPLMSPYELRDVLGWLAEESLWKLHGGVLDFVTIQGAPGLNPNTAPWQTLTALPGVTREIAQAIIDRRELEPINVAWLDALLGTKFSTPPSPVRAFPSNSVRVTQWVPGLQWGYQYNVKLTPNGAVSPWVIGYFYRLERVQDSVMEESPSKSPAHEKDLPRFPPRPAVAPSSPSLLAQ